jgi:hypothetical protein
MGAIIKGAEYPVSAVFSQNFDYVIPNFQRPYAWTEEETGKLFSDLYDFYTGQPEDEQYFLGSVVLYKPDEKKPFSEVIDGQQRLTTLTILLALITSMIPKDDIFYDDFYGFIIEKGSPLRKIPAKPRLTIREREREFFRKYVQEFRFDELFALDDGAQSTESKKNIILNARQLSKNLKQSFDSIEKIKEFGSFIAERCFIVQVTTSTREAAFRIFSVMNNRGLDLKATDIFKANLIGVLPVSLQDEYTDKWEEMEVQLGREGFNDLFAAIRMIRAKVKAKVALQDEFEQVVIPEKNKSTVINFIDNILEPFCEAYRVVKNCDYMATSGADQVNDILQWLNRLDNSDWIPSALLFYSIHKSDSTQLNKFLRRLERLAAYMRATSWDVTHRIERYGSVLKDIENNVWDAIELTREEIDEFISCLNSDMYKMVSKKRNYLILRLDSFVSDGAATYDSKILTIEHVLPQTVAEGSQWAEWWPDQEERNYWVHKIGNLLPLAKRTNSQAQNYDFDLKKDKYFTGKAGASSFALTSQVLRYDVWKPETVKARQEELLKIYIDNWDLQ